MDTAFVYYMPRPFNDASIYQVDLQKVWKNQKFQYLQLIRFLLYY